MHHTPQEPAMPWVPDVIGRGLQQGHQAPVMDLAVDASGGLLASGSADRNVRIWDTDRGYCTHVFEGHTCGD